MKGEGIGGSRLSMLKSCAAFLPSSTKVENRRTWIFPASDCMHCQVNSKATTP